MPDLPDPSESAAGAALSSRPLDGDRERWLALLDLLDLERLRDDFLRRLDDVEEYRDGKVERRALAEAAESSFRGLIGRMREDTAEALESAAFALGTSRARAGVSREALMTAIRLDYLVLWNALVSVASADDAPLLLRHADYVWQIVDEYARRAQDGYLVEREMLTDERQLTQRALISELVDASRPNRERTVEIAEALGMPMDARYVILAAEGKEATTLRRLLTGNKRVGGSVISFYRGGTLLVLTTAATWYSRPALQAIREGTFGGAVAVDGFAEVWSGARLATELAGLPPRDEVKRRRFDDWPRLVRKSLSDTHLDLILSIEAGLAECTPAEREALEQSIRAYLDTGSVHAAAARMFCHRNTMTNRMRRFTELTGIDVTVPVAAARVVLAWA
ncbi:CdaR family transcriptional regulator [Gulosibacter sp. 10]|uniref:PucR family transcriptional regulator n=1 Tax=Gulosibacter sp. 10 TaxID=1255570 RepID=UPI00097EA847|nr:helix-turn-helix domain-containing protein [Gulosibacter sp. 10]SJM67307.1 Regulator of polyketide synthase expression [Gulosibacter sp. 10]